MRIIGNSVRTLVAGALLGGLAFAQSDRLVIGIGAEVQSMDPMVATDVASFTRLNAIMEPLVVFDPSFALQPRLAHSWELADDISTLTFYLRDDVVYHNGHPFTSADVRYTFETVLDPDAGASNAALYAAIGEIETPDDYTVVFHLNQPHVFLINNMARMPIVPNDPEHDHSVHPIGTGPYSFVSQVRDDRMILERFDDYWGGAGELQFLEYRVIPENSTRLLAFEAGELDVTQTQLPTTELERLEADPNWVMERTPGTGYTFLAFNTEVAPFDDYRVRQALNHLIPREALVERIINGNGFPGISMLLPTMAWFNPDGPEFDYNPERARELLEEAGVSFDTPFRLHTNQDNVRLQVAEVLAFEFTQIGLEVEIHSEEAAAFLARIQQTSDYDLIISGWSGSPPSTKM